MKQLTDSIELFCSYFYDQVRGINSLTINQESTKNTDQDRHQIRFYKKVLLITHLDTLAGIRYTKERYPKLNRENKERFIKFLSTNDVWPNGSMVSIPFLAEHTNSGKISNGLLKDFVLNKLDKNYGAAAGLNVRASEIDVSFDELIELTTTEQEEKVIIKNRHYEILYRYRNYLVHESNEPGMAMEYNTEEEPYYHEYIGENKLFLAYPINMLSGILQRSIKCLEKYLKENRMNPYNYVKETERW